MAVVINITGEYLTTKAFPFVAESLELLVELKRQIRAAEPAIFKQHFLYTFTLFS